MGYVSSIVKGESTASKSGIWWQEERLPDGENWLGKYQGCNHYSDGDYVKVWYEGNKFSPERTYTDEYCRKSRLGKYANSGSSSSSSKSSSSSSSSGGGIGAALGAGAIGLAKKAFEETPEEKAKREKEEAEDEKISEIVERKMEILEKQLKQEYPLDTKDAATMLGLIVALHEVVLSHKDVSDYEKEDFHSKLKHEYETDRLETEAKHLYKLIKKLNKKTNLRTIYKTANKYSGYRMMKFAGGLVAVIFFFVLLLLAGA